VSSAGNMGGEFNTFRVLSAIFLVVCTAGSFFMKNPPEGYNPCPKKAAVIPLAPKSFTTTEMLKRPHFYLLTGAFMLACMGGLIMIGFASPIAGISGLSGAFIGVLAISFFNSVGRLIWGTASERLGRINTLLILLVGSIVMALLLIPAARTYWLYVVIGCIGFFYGGSFSTFPALTADLFGPKHMATNYGVVLLGFGAGAILASQIGGVFNGLARDAGDVGMMFPAFIIAAVLSALGIVLLLVLKALNKRDKKEITDCKLQSANMDENK